MELSQKKRGNACLFTFKGRLDSNTSPSSEQTIMNAIADGEKFLIFDFSNLSYLSSAGIRTIVQCYKKVEHAQGHIYLVNVSKPIENILYITGFLPYFQLFSTIDEATNALTKASQKL